MMPHPIILRVSRVFALCLLVFTGGSLCHTFAQTQVNIERANQIRARARLMKIQQLNEQGKYAEALRFGQQLLDIYDRGNESPSKALAMSLDILGGLYLSFGDFEKANAILHRALKMHTEQEGPQSAEAAHSLGLIAKTKIDTGELQAALAVAREALLIRQRVFGTDHFMVSTSLNTLGEIYDGLGQFEAAERCYKRAVAIRTKHQNIHGLVVTLNKLGRLYYRIGAYESALIVAETALEIGDPIFADDHPHLAETLNLLGVIHAATQKYATSYGYFKRAQYIQLKALSDMGGYTSEYEKLTYVDKIEADLHVFLSLIAFHLPQSSPAITEGLNIVLKRKGIVLEVQRQFQKALFKGNPRGLRLFDRISGLRAVISNMIFVGPQNTSWQTYVKNLNRLKKEKEALEIRLRKISPAYALSEMSAAADSDQLALALRPGTALVELVAVRRFHAAAAVNGKWGALHYLAFLLEAQRPNSVRLIDLGNAAQIDDCLFELKKTMQRYYTLEHDRIRSLAGWLYRHVFFPFEEKLGDVRYLYVSPDGNLNLIPFEVFQYPDGRFLIENYTFNYLSSGRDILKFGASTVRPGNSVLIGNPDFDLSIKEKSATLDNLAIYAIDTSNKRFSDDLKLEAFPQLPPTAIQVNRIAMILGKENADVFLGKKALEEVLMQVASPRFLHLATHGFFIEDQNIGPVRIRYLNPSADDDNYKNAESELRESPLIRSGIALSGANRFFDRKSGLHGIVTAEKIVGLNLQGTEMVVLSACETGRGTVKTGEGVFGLRRAFTQAGARSLVMSMWQAVGEVTSDLMTNLYHNITVEKMNRAEALRGAALRQLRIQQQTDDYANPYFWGAFVFLGEP